MILEKKTFGICKKSGITILQPLSMSKSDKILVSKYFFIKFMELSQIPWYILSVEMEIYAIFQI